MSQFSQGAESRLTLSPEVVRRAIDDALMPENVHVVGSLQIIFSEWRAEEPLWEVFNGRLLDPRYCRQRRAFETRMVNQRLSADAGVAPLLSVKFAAADECVYVTRFIECHVTEGYDTGDSVIQSRETPKWVEELVATLELAPIRNAEALREELRRSLFEAFVGTSRLPLTSIEAPLPGFTLGQIFYCQPSDKRELTWLEKIKTLEHFIRATPPDCVEGGVGAMVACLTRWNSVPQLPSLLRALIDHVSLTPYTDFVPSLLTILDLLVARHVITCNAHIDFLSYVLRQLGRHLTAYDLITFHHRGANYPDALLLDAALKAYMKLIDRHPDLFVGKTASHAVRRRALRQAWYFRRLYEGLPVPDAPTSPGENARILPPPHKRVPEEQLTDTTKRTRKLFENDPLEFHVPAGTKPVLDQCWRDLRSPGELRELGMAVFVDRPLGVAKRPGEPDRTPLLSYEAFSQSIARRRIDDVEKRFAMLNRDEAGALHAQLEHLPVDGVLVSPAMQSRIPGRVSVGDAWRVASDFRFLSTTNRAAREFMSSFDWSPLTDLLDVGDKSPWLIISESANEVLTIYTKNFLRRYVFRINIEAGYVMRHGIEFPTNGLQLMRIGEKIEGEWREHSAEVNIGLREAWRPDD